MYTCPCEEWDYGGVARAYSSRVPAWEALRKVGAEDRRRLQSTPPDGHDVVAQRHGRQHFAESAIRLGAGSIAARMVSSIAGSACGRCEKSRLVRWEVDIVEVFVEWRAWWLRTWCSFSCAGRLGP